MHEILCGPLRQKALDQVYALLVTCWHCNGSVVTDKRVWPEARQLAVLLQHAPENYDLAAFCRLANEHAPHRVTQSEVDVYLVGSL